MGKPLKPLISELPQHVIPPDPQLSDTTLFLTVLFRNFQVDISALRE